MFNVRVPVDQGDDVFLVNTFTDAQLLVSRDVLDLLDRRTGRLLGLERGTLDQLSEHGFVVRDRESERAT